MSDKPVVALVDDDLDEMSAVIALMERRGLEVRPREPDEVTLDDLEHADVVLVDWTLQGWQGRGDTSLPLATRPQDGLALAEVLRSHLDHEHAGRPTAFALHSGALRDLGRGIPKTIQEFALARIHNLEWVFGKAEGQGIVNRFVALADALRALPHPWPSDPDERRTELIRLLAFRAEDSLAWQSVADCHPPLHELADNSNGLTILRWLAQRILPYPTFLLDDWYVAARLGVQVDSLQRDLERGGELTELLEPARYGGILSEFLGARWWRTRVDDVIWELTGGGAANPQRVRDAVAKLVPGTELLEITNPVVCVDATYRPIEVVDAAHAVRIDLDDRPPFAFEAWATTRLAIEDPAIRSRVTPEDRDRLDA